MNNKFKYFNISMYEYTLDNGLRVIMIPDKNKKEVCASYTTIFGSIHTEFKLNNKFIKVPNGIAHFLEHKSFEMEKDEDPFTFYSKTGTYNNAFTNYFNTTYIISCNNKFSSNLEYLLNFVEHPYFTDENVLKEKGIIAEEINMYKDMPDSVLYERINKNLFINSNAKYTISGEVKDINTITKEDLYNCYNTFYTPSNMFITITGNFDYLKTINLIKKYEKNNNKISNIVIKKVNEPFKVSKEYEEIKYNVVTPYTTYALKININDYDIDKLKFNIYINILFEILFDETSLFYEYLINKKIIDSNIDIDTINIDGYKVIYLTFKSNKYKEIIDLIDKKLKNIKVTKEELERKKKVYISGLIYAFEDPDTVNNYIIRNVVKYNKVNPNIYDTINELNIDELNDIIAKLNYKKAIVVMKKN